MSTEVGDMSSTSLFLSAQRRLHRARNLVSLSLISGALIACSSSNNDSAQFSEVTESSSEMAAPAPAAVRVIHASPDAPPVNITLNGSVAVSDLDYADSSGFATVDPGSYDIGVLGQTPAGEVEVISVSGFELAEASRTTILAVDRSANIEPLVVTDSEATPSSDEVALRVVHASPDAPAVDVYVTDPDADIASASPALSFEFRQDVDAGALSAGLVTIRVALEGSDTVVYDSGPVDLSGFAGEQLLVAAISSTAPAEISASPVKLLVSTDDAALVLRDTNTASAARVVHLAPDANEAAGGPVEVFASSAELGADPVQLIDAFDYTDTVPAVDAFVTVPAGDYVFDVAPNTNTIGDSVFASPTVALETAAAYTAVAVGRVLTDPAFSLLLTEDSARPIATQASVKIIHGAPAAGTVNVFVTPAGEVSVLEIEAGNGGEPLLTDFEFASITDYVAVNPGSYDVRVVAGGSVAINIENLSLAGGSVATAIARGPSESEHTGPDDFGVILLTQ